MAYVLRLIAGAALLFWSFNSFSDSVVLPPVYTSGVDKGSSVCHVGHVYQFLEFIPGNDDNDTADRWVYEYTSSTCGDTNPGNGSGSGSGDNPPPSGSGGGNGSGGNPGSGSGNGSNPSPPSDNDGGNSGTPPPNPPPHGSPPSDNPGNGSGSGNSGSGENGYGSGVPDDAKICNEDDDYWHDCYRVNAVSGKWRYWHNDDSEEICDILESKNEWDDCYFDGDYYRKTGFRSSNRWNDYNDYRYNRCKDDHDVDHSTDDYMEATSKWYCIERYRGTDESALYEFAVSNFKNNKTAADILSDADGDDGDEKDKDEIDIRKKFKISEDGEGTLSSSIPDLLENYVPEKSGAHGVCLDDLTIEIGATEIILEISRVCEWLEILGKILVFISLFVAIRIVTRD